jgi:uracil-DNA glycosylase
VRGQPFEVKGFWMFPMLHPAAALHREHFQQAVREDFQRLRTFLDQAPQPAPPREQMKLF